MATRKKRKKDPKSVVRESERRTVGNTRADPKSVVRRSERSTVGNAALVKAFRAFKKANPNSVVRESEFIARRKKRKK